MAFIFRLTEIIEKPHIVTYGHYYSITTVCIALSIILFIMYKICYNKHVKNYIVRHKMVKTDNNSDIDEISLHTPSPRRRTSLA